MKNLHISAIDQYFIKAFLLRNWKEGSSFSEVDKGLVDKS